MRIRKKQDVVGVVGTMATEYTEASNACYNAPYINDNFQTKGTILWTNDSPTTAMTDGTQINLSSNDYDVLEVICEYSTSNRDLMFSFKGLKGKNIGLLVNSCNNTLTTVGRIMTYVNDTKYTLSIGHMNIGTSTSVSDNQTGCIPLYIIGYKTNLFN